MIGDFVSIGFVWLYFFFYGGELNFVDFVMWDDLGGDWEFVWLLFCWSGCDLFYYFWCLVWFFVLGMDWVGGIGMWVENYLFWCLIKCGWVFKI